MPPRTGRKTAADREGAGAGGEGAADSAGAGRSGVLERAARRVNTDMYRGLADVEASPGDLPERLDELVRVIDSGEETLSYRGLAVTDAALTHWLLDELRGYVLEEWALLTPPPRAQELIDVFRAFERVRHELATSSDQQLSRLLTSFRGLELLVELAHDFRSPLTSIIFLSEALRQQQSGKVNPLQSRQLGIIYTAALGLVSMASDVIELVRGDRLVADSPTSFSIAEMLESIRDLVEPMAETKGLALRIEAPESDRRIGYPVVLSRVLLNLTTNALKFTERGHVEISIRELDELRFEFSVRDTGRGIDAAAGDLFSAIRVNLSSDRPAFSGSGLGLAICRRLLGSIGAELRFEGAVGEGTRFFFQVDLPQA